MAQPTNSLPRLRGSCGARPLGTPVPPRKYPTEDAENRSPAPAVVAAPALDSAHPLHETADHREEQVHACDREQQPLHDNESTSCSIVGAPSKPAALVNPRHASPTDSPPLASASRPSTKTVGD